MRLGKPLASRDGKVKTNIASRQHPYNKHVVTSKPTCGYYENYDIITKVLDGSFEKLFKRACDINISNRKSPLMTTTYSSSGASVFVWFIPL